MLKSQEQIISVNRLHFDQSYDSIVTIYDQKSFIGLIPGLGSGVNFKALSYQGVNPIKLFRSIIYGFL